MKYLVSQNWAYDVEEPYEKCSITIATEEDEKWDGYNIISGANRNGMSFDIYDTLEQAIVQAHFNPDGIEFADDIDKNEINSILDKYIWNPYHGLINKIILDSN